MSRKGKRRRFTISNAEMSNSKLFWKFWLVPPLLLSLNILLDFNLKDLNI